MHFSRHLALAAVAVVAFGASAQQVYRIVGPDGRVTFSDKPPADSATKASPAAVVPFAGPAAPALAGASLPFELRQVAGRYPVTLYTGPQCGPCQNARAFLSSRGIPFSERTVSTSQDIDALQRLAGAATLPFVTIGGQQLRGFSEMEWSQYLDAAGYPKTSALPAGYRQAAPAPLVAVHEAVRPAIAQPSVPSQPTSPPALPTGPSPSNPAGITF